MAVREVNECFFRAGAGGLVGFVASTAIQGWYRPQDVTTPAIINGGTYHYRAESDDMSQFESGIGTWNSGTSTLARTLVFQSSATGAAVNFTLPPRVRLVLLAQDVADLGIVQIDEINLGHASDTTFTRVSPGVAAIEGQNILTAATGQPLDSDLTAIALLTTTAFGRSLLTLADDDALAAQVDSFFLTPAEGNLAYQPLDTDLTALAAIVGVQGDIIYRNASAWVRLPAGTSGQFLKTLGAGGNPLWDTVVVAVGRDVLTANREYHVDFDAGSDITGDGSIGSPWKTLQFADDFIAQTIDLAGFSLRVNVAPSASTYVGIENFTGYYNSDADSILNVPSIGYVGTGAVPSDVVVGGSAVQGLCWGQFAPNFGFLHFTFGRNMRLEPAGNSAIWVDPFFVGGRGQGNIIIGIDPITGGGGDVELGEVFSGQASFSGHVSISGNLLCDGAAWSENCAALIDDGAESGTDAIIFLDGNVTITGNPVISSGIFSFAARGRGRFLGTITGAWTGPWATLRTLSTLFAPNWATNGTPTDRPYIDRGAILHGIALQSYEGVGAEVHGGRTDYSTPTTGFSITLDNYARTVVLDPAGTLATGTITMPPFPIDRQVIQFRSSAQITAMTFTPNAGQSLEGEPTSFPAGAYIDALYRHVDTTWYFTSGSIDAGASTPPGGLDTYVQYNDVGAFGGDAGLVYNKATDILTVGQAVYVTGGTDGFRVGAGGYFYFEGRTNLRSVGDGLLRLANDAENDFGLLQLGGITSAFPAIKRNAAGIDFRVADDSAFAAIAALSATLSVPLAVSSGGTGQATEAEAVGELIQALAAEATLDMAADYVAIYDASADTGKKVLLSVLLAGSSGTPGGANTQVQYNDSGSFGGDAKFLFNETSGHVAMGPGATIDQVGYAFVPSRESLNIRDTITSETHNITYGIYNQLNIDLAANANLQTYSMESVIFIDFAMDKNIALDLYGLSGVVADFGTGTRGNIYGVSGYCDTSSIVADSYGAIGWIQATDGSIAESWGVFSRTNVAGAAINIAYMFGGEVAIPGLGSIFGLHGLWLPDLTLGTDHNYAFWYDSPGVVRIKGDGVYAYYNPAFVPKYVPNAVDHERLVLQWNANVIEIGAEAGGTGVLRPLGLIGSFVQTRGETALVNSVHRGLDIRHQTSGSPANGIGVGLQFSQETSAGNVEIGAAIDAVVTDVTVGSEDFALLFNTMAAGAAAVERMRITSVGRVLINYPTVLTTSGLVPRLQLALNSPGVDNGITWAVYGEDIGGAVQFALKTRGADPGTHAIVENEDDLFEIQCRGSDGIGYIRSAGMLVTVDGVPGTNDMPGRFTFHTTPVGGSAALERLRINSAGVVRLGVPSETTGPLAFAHASSAFLTTFQAGNAVAARTYVWPTDFGAAGSTLTDAAGDGVLSWVTGGAGYTDEQAQDAVGGILVDSSTIDFTYNDATPSITAIVIDDSITNAKLANMVEATVKGRALGAGTGDPTDLTGAQVLAIIEATTPLVSTAEGNAAYAVITRDLIAGAGLTGGGTLSADRTFDVGAGTGITVNANDVALTIPVAVSSGGTGQTTAAEAIGELTQALTEDSIDYDVDFLSFYDDSADTGKKIKPIILMKRKLLADTTIYVRTDGNNANLGFTDDAAGAKLTLQAAFDLAKIIDANGFRLAIQMRAGTFAGGTLAEFIPNVAGPPGWAGYLELYGDDNVGGTIIDGVGLAGNLNVSTLIYVDDFAFSKRFRTATALSGIAHDGDGLIVNGNFAGPRFDLIAGASSFFGTLTVNGNGNSQTLFRVLGGTCEFFGTLTVTSAPNYTVAVVNVDGNGSTFFGAPFASGVTGKRFAVDNQGMLNTFSGDPDAIAGNAAGTVDGGGFYL